MEELLNQSNKYIPPYNFVVSSRKINQYRYWYMIERKINMNRNKKIETWEEASDSLNKLFDEYNETHKDQVYFNDWSGYYFEELHVIRIQLNFNDCGSKIYLIPNKDITPNGVLEVINNECKKDKEGRGIMENKTELEKEMLYKRIKKLTKFLQSEEVDKMSNDAEELLFDQLKVMWEYFHILEKRLRLAKNEEKFKDLFEEVEKEKEEK